ncbi:hypothetical protein [Aeromonas veronii]|uniref:hypothetical protein n=1 Tax=Aeromonas veronii TaxID=654 RepID=UPI002443E162|nr:hypothetical protein [Aeromonas veronii]
MAEQPLKSNNPKGINKKRRENIDGLLSGMRKYLQSDKNKAANMAALLLNRRAYFVVEVVVLVLVLVESSLALATTTAASAAAPTPTATRVVVPTAAVPATPVEPAAVPATSSAANAFEERTNIAARVNADFFITNFLI